MLKTETNSKNSIRDMIAYLSTENGLAQLKAVYKKNSTYVYWDYIDNKFSDVAIIGRCAFRTSSDCQFETLVLRFERKSTENLNDVLKTSGDRAMYNRFVNCDWEISSFSDDTISEYIFKFILSKMNDLCSGRNRYQSFYNVNNFIETAISKKYINNDSLKKFKVFQTGVLSKIYIIAFLDEDKFLDELNDTIFGIKNVDKFSLSTINGSLRLRNKEKQQYMFKSLLFLGLQISYKKNNFKIISSIAKIIANENVSSYYRYAASDILTSSAFKNLYNKANELISFENEGLVVVNNNNISDFNFKNSVLFDKDVTKLVKLSIVKYNIEISQAFYIFLVDKMSIFRSHHLHQNVSFFISKDNKETISTLENYKNEVIKMGALYKKEFDKLTDYETSSEIGKEIQKLIDKNALTLKSLNRIVIK